MLRKALLSFFVTLTAAVPAHAQLLQTDATWLSCRALFSADAVPCTPGAGTTAVDPLDLPDGWQPGPWIRAGGGNPLPGADSTEDPLYQYGFQTSFTGSAGAHAIVIERFQIDNYFKASSASGGTPALESAGFFLNGSAIAFDASDWLTTPGYGGVPEDPNAENWTKIFSIALGVNLLDGENVFEVRTTGNGNNDGMALRGNVAVVDINFVPEPTSITPMTLGLVGLVLAARRRRAA